MGGILGIGGFDHDGAVSLVRGGTITGHLEWTPGDALAVLRAGRVDRLFVEGVEVWPASAAR